MIAFLGTGLLGSGFARALRRRGEQVTVWNRTASRARPLEADGIAVRDDVAGAVRGAARIHLSLSDDAAVDDTLERAGVAPGQVIVDHTTTSVAGTRARAARWAERGIEFLHAPVFMGPQNALDATGTMLASGDRARYDRLAPELAKMTGKLVYLGEAPERAAGFKLTGNLFLMFVTTGMIEMIAFARAVGIAPADAVTLFESFNPGTTLQARAKRILDAAYDKPSWELAMARKDARLMLDDAGAAVHILPAIAAEMDRWIARGHGHDDWTVMASDAVR
ncbi:MAG: NAD(P)-dependent oxidoreductase [Deltaproteobacteria bacterium]|nr:NAD(P)-dependent oxidoreductase [Deltaproteobacteria bacterium]MCW5805634.1 NAD(P)-dependent oxidoreductase [Deltaproteobacteria bacterium]